MVQGSGPMPEVKHSGERAKDELFRLLDSGFKVKSTRKVRGDCAGECAAGTMSIRVVDALREQEGDGTIGANEHIVRIKEIVTALTQDGAAKFPMNSGGGMNHIVKGVDRRTRKNFGFGYIRRNEGSERQKEVRQSGNSIIINQSIPGSSDHNGVDDEIRDVVKREPFSDDTNKGDTRDHTGFNGIGEDIRENAVKLLREKVRRDFNEGANAASILGNEGSNGRHCEDAMSGHSFNIGLNTSATGGISSRNRQSSKHRKKDSFQERVILEIAGTNRTPHFSFLCREKRETGRSRSKEKRALGRLVENFSLEEGKREDQNDLPVRLTPLSLLRCSRDLGRRRESMPGLRVEGAANRNIGNNHRKS